MKRRFLNDAPSSSKATDTEHEAYTVDEQLDLAINMTRSTRNQGIDYDHEIAALREAIKARRTEALREIQERSYCASNPFLDSGGVARTADFESSIDHDCVVSNCTNTPEALWTIPVGTRYTSPLNGLQYQASGVVYVCYATGRRHICTYEYCDFQRPNEHNEDTCCALTHRTFGAPMVSTYVSPYTPVFEDGTRGHGKDVIDLADTVLLTARTQLYEFRRDDVDNKRAARNMLARRIERASVSEQQTQQMQQHALQLEYNKRLLLTAPETAAALTSTALVTAQAAQTIAAAQREARGIVPRVVALSEEARTQSTELMCVDGSNNNNNETTPTTTKVGTVMIPGDARAVRRLLFKPTIADLSQQSVAIDSPQHSDRMRAYFTRIASGIVQRIWNERSRGTHAARLKHKHAEAERALAEQMRTAKSPLQLMATFMRITRHDQRDVARVLAYGDRFPLDSSDSVGKTREEITEALVARMINVWCRVQATPLCVREQAWQHYQKNVVAIVNVAVNGLLSAVCITRGENGAEYAHQLCPESPYCGHVRREIVFVPKQHYLSALITAEHIKRLAADEGRQGTLSADNAVRLYYISLFDNSSGARSLADIERDFCIHE